MKRCTFVLMLLLSAFTAHTSLNATKTEPQAAGTKRQAPATPQSLATLKPVGTAIPKTQKKQLVKKQKKKLQQKRKRRLSKQMQRRQERFLRRKKTQMSPSVRRPRKKRDPKKKYISREAQWARRVKRRQKSGSTKGGLSRTAHSNQRAYLEHQRAQRARRASGLPVLRKRFSRPSVISPYRRKPEKKEEQPETQEAPKKAEQENQEGQVAAEQTQAIQPKTLEQNQEQQEDNDEPQE